MTNKIDGIVSVKADFKKGTAIVTVKHGAKFDKKMADSAIGKDYDVEGVTPVSEITN